MMQLLITAILLFGLLLSRQVRRSSAPAMACEEFAPAGTAVLQVPGYLDSLTLTLTLTFTINTHSHSPWTLILINPAIHLTTILVHLVLHRPRWRHVAAGTGQWLAADKTGE